MEGDRRRLHLFRGIYPILREVPGFICLQGLDRQLRFADAGFRERFGDPCNRPLHEIIPEVKGLSPREAASRESAGSPMEWEGVLADGRRYKVVASPFTEIDGSSFLLVLGLDVTGAGSRPEPDPARMPQPAPLEGNGGKKRNAGRKRPRARAEDWSETALRSFFDSSPLMMGIVEILSDDILHISDNTASGAFLGLDPRIMKNRTAREMGAAPQHVREWIGHCREAERTGRSHRFEYIHRGTSGGSWLSATVSPAGRGPSGRPRFSYVIEDITERRRVDAKLRDQGEMLQAIVHASPVVIETVDREGNLRMWNRAAERIFGWTEEEVRGRFQPTVPEEDRGAFLALVDRVLRGETVRDVETRRRRKDGSLLDARMSMAPLHGQNGTVYGAVAVLEDVTERKRAEEELSRYRRRLEIMVAERTAELTRINEKLRQEIEERRRTEEELRQSEVQYRSIVETATEGIWVVGHDDRTVFVNQIMADMLGYPVSEIIGENPEIFVPREERTDLEAFYIRYRRGLKNRVEFRLRRKDGSDLWVIISATPYFDRKGRYAGGLGMITDITDHKRLEEELRHSQRLEAVGRLAGGVAHEFNNMMTVVTGYSELLLSRLPESDPMRKEVDQIQKAGDRASVLTKQLLAFGRKQILQPRELDLNAVVSHMEKMLHRLIGEDVELVTIRGPELWEVRADPGQIEQVIVNLAVNARDAMPRGGRLTIETANSRIDEPYTSHHPDLGPGEYVMLAISDTGCGMDAETRSRIFEPFFTTKEVGQGTGLGLSTVYGIVKQSEGHIWVYSEPGQGATFKVFLPRIRIAGRPAEAEEAPAEAPQGRETILVAEDEETVRTLVRRILQERGYTVLAASGGDEALEMASRHRDRRIHLLLADVVMPGMNGQELADRVTRLHPGIRTLFMSGYTESTIAHRGLLSPRAAFIQKPFQRDSLALKVRELLDAPEEEEDADPQRKPAASQ